MKLTYIFHSGFAIEADNITIIIDYWQDPANIVPHLLQNSGSIYVLSSHFHQDHFNPEILRWKDKRPGIHYILSKDIWRHRRNLINDISSNMTFLAKGQTYKDEFIYVEAFGSTDVGVSWYIETNSKRIFHSGDLNNWLWLDDSTPEESARYQQMFLGELTDIHKKVKTMDVAMFPVDSRIGTDYMRGARQFVDKFRIGLFVPMHFTAQPIADAWAFKDYAISKDTNFFEIKKESDTIEF